MTATWSRLAATTSRLRPGGAESQGLSHGVRLGVLVFVDVRADDTAMESARDGSMS